MLELIQKRFQTIVLALLVGALCATFVISFGGPQSRGCALQGGVTGTAARIYDQTLTEGDFRAAYTLLGFHQIDPVRARSLNLREIVLDGMIERELLAHEAERLGFRADGREVMRGIAESGIIWANLPVDAPDNVPGPQIRQSFDDRDGRFSSKNMQRVIRNYLRRSVEEFERWQSREHLAELVRQSVAATATVSPLEVHDQYLRETERATIEYVRFTPTFYRDRIQPTPAELTAWMAAHTEEVDQEYQRQRHRYTGLELQRRARHVLIKAAESAPETERNAARARAEAILRRAQGGEDFATLARENSEDTGSARRGGDLGWNARGRMVAPFDEAQFGTEPGTLTDHVVQSTFGFHVIKVEGSREGDVPEEEAKRELSEGLYERARASELAREEADRALTYAREGHSFQELDQQLAWNWRAPAVAEGAPEAPERDTFAPTVRDSRSFGRAETPVSGATNGGELTRAAFELTAAAPLPAGPLQLGDDWYVFRLKDRTEATEANYTADVQQRIRGQLIAAKQSELLKAYVHRLREQADEDGALRVSESILLYEDERDDGEGEGEGEEGGEETPEEEPEAESALPVRRQALGA